MNLDHPKINGETTVKNAISEVAAIMGENVKFRRGYTMSASSSGLLSTYLHTSPNPGKQINSLITLVQNELMEAYSAASIHLVVMTCNLFQIICLTL